MRIHNTVVANPESLSRIPYPDFYRLLLQIRKVDTGSHIMIFSFPDEQIPDPTKARKDEWEKIVVHPIFVATNITKLKLILCLN
jgi:hypothetical protein